MLCNLRDSEVRSITTLALLNIHLAGECLPHAVLPLQIVFLHALIVVALTALADADGTHLLEVTVDIPSNKIVVLIRPVTETEDDILQAIEFVRAIAEFERVVREVLAKSDSVIGGLSLTVGRHDEENAAILRHLIQVFEFVLFRVADERCKTKFGLGLLRKPDSILLRSTCLRAIKDDDPFFLHATSGSVGRAKADTLTPSFIFVTKSRGSPEPWLAAPFEEGTTGADLGLDVKSWSRKR